MPKEPLTRDSTEPLTDDGPARLYAGSASADITPDESVPLAGYGAREGAFTGVHDPVGATALVLADGAITVAIVSVDLLNVSRELVASVRRALATKRVPIDDLVVVATHTHGGPYVPARAIDVSPLLSTDADVTDAVAGYLDGIVTSVTRAVERLEPASLRVGRATNRTVPENRRAAGGVGDNVRMPWGAIDPELTALLVETASGRETVLYNFACHPVCTTPGETLVSADWPGYAAKRVIEERGTDDVLFVNGAAGDINPSGKSDADAGDAVYDYMASTGAAVGETVLDALSDAESTRRVTRPPIRTAHASLDLPVKETPPREQIQRRLSDLETKLDELERAGDETGYAKVTWDWRYVQLLAAYADWDATTLPADLRYLSVGDVGILGMPGEILVRHGFDFKARAQVGTLVLAGYANGYVGYVPTLADLENVGYEVRSARIAPEAITTFRDAAFELIE